MIEIGANVLICTRENVTSRGNRNLQLDIEIVLRGLVWMGENVLTLLITCILARAILIFVTLVKFPSAIYGSYAGHGECHDIGF